MSRNDYFAYFANRLMQRGKSKGCACVATASRFMWMVFWMIHDQKSFKPPDGLGISKDPLANIELFLSQRHASGRIEEYINHARRYFDQSQPEGGGSIQVISVS